MWIGVLACLAVLGGRAEPVTIRVDSPAFVFSPANWVGDAGRGGAVYRQTWNPGAYFRVTWEGTPTEEPPVLLFDTSTYDGSLPPPVVACNLDGVWTADLPCAAEVPVPGIDAKQRTHVLTCYFKKSAEDKRWGTADASGLNVVRIQGVRLADDAKGTPRAASPKWLLIVGDSITEGIGAAELEGYSYLVGQAFRALDYEYAISACGWSGWLHTGDRPPGDVPGYYVVEHGTGTYVDALSRWNKIDSRHSLLDADGHLSAYGGTGQEPAVILMNYGTNDAIHKTDVDDLKGSMAGGLAALRGAAPDAYIFILIPFGQYRVAELRTTVADFQAAHPDDRRIAIVDLGPDAARALRVKGGFWGGLHPNARGHANFAAQVVARMVQTLTAADAR